MKAYLSTQQPLTLGKILGQGGEGRVFALADGEQHAVKIYHQLPSTDKQAKLQAMVGDNLAVLSKIALWPTELVYNLQQQIVGFVMPRLPVGSVAIHHLYNPSQRKQDFPKADYAFLVHTARNLAAAFAYLHSCGHCVGDVNQGNVVVAPDATITLIDCDSFQVNHQGQTFACEVGVAHFTPPELHGQPFAEITKTPTHDNFGLAILIFHVLMMGRHPFAGVYLGEGEMPIEKAITEFRYAYSRNAQAKQMQAPPKAPSTAWLSTNIRQLFESAFDEDINKRPTAQQWLTALEEFGQQLVTCDEIKQHKYYKELIECPLCEFYSRYRVDFFVVNRINQHPLKAIKKFTSIKPREIKQSLHLIRVPELSEKLPEYPTKRFMSKAVSRGHICWSYWLVYLLIFSIVMTSSLAKELFFFFIIMGLPISAFFWIVITHVLISLRHTDDKFIWLLDQWLTSSGYLETKEKYYVKKQQMLDFDKVWQQHLAEGQKVLNFKKEILSLCDEYALLVSNDDSALQHQKRIEYLAHRLPKTPKELNQKVGFYQNKTEQLLQEWQALNMEHIELALSYHVNGETLLPEQNQISQTPEVAQVKNVILIVMALPIIMMTAKFFGGVEQLTNKPISALEIEQQKTNTAIVIDQVKSIQQHQQEFSKIMEQQSQFLHQQQKIQPSNQENFWREPTPIYGYVLHVVNVYTGVYPEDLAAPPSSVLPLAIQGQGTVKIKVKYNPKVSSVILVLNSYESVEWNIIAEKGVKIDKIILSSYSNSSTVVGALKGVSIIRKNLELSYKQNELPQALVNDMKNEFGINSFTTQNKYQEEIFELN